ncbi:MAG: cytidylate kinase-like family protein [Desulfuromonadales bacterium]|nr:cytidylate kinase-like family protein [Desulfuromonadales bacterium]
MLEKTLVPSVEKRIGSLLEYNRRRELESSSKSQAKKARPTITLSREFGCEAYPVAECLQELLEKKTSETWLVMDKELLREIARKEKVSGDVLMRLGEKPSFLDEMIATFSPSWKSDKDYFQLICSYIVELAQQGNVILVGRGSAFITQSMKNCRHFRLYASAEFKIRSISHRLGLSREEAERQIEQGQRQREQFIRTFLDRDSRDLSVYNLVFNHDRNSVDKIADTIVKYVMEC